MKTRNLIFSISWSLLALLMIVAAVAQWYRAEYWLALIAAIAFGCDAYSAWNQFGLWLEARKTLKKSREATFADYDKTMAEWEQGFQNAT